MDFRIHQERQVHFALRPLPHDETPVLPPAVRGTIIRLAPHLLQNAGLHCTAVHILRRAGDERAVAVLTALRAGGTAQHRTVLHQCGLHAEARRRNRRHGSGDSSTDHHKIIFV